MSSQSEHIEGRRFRLTALERRGGAVKGVVVALAILCVVLGFVGWRMKSSKGSKKVDLIFATCDRGTFIHEVNGKGSAESAKNVDVASQVEGTATVIYLIPEGTDVKKGDLLVELDSSDVDEKLDSQVVTTNTSRATLNSSRATLRSAEISLEEYVEGTFEQSWMEYENTIFEAEQTRKQQADSARFTERLLNLNYSTELQYEIDKVAEEKAKNSLEVANLKKMTLLKYTSEKEITSLMSDIETARAKVDSDKNSYNINLNRENRYRAISANCKIKAPQDGQVVYANQDSRRMSESDMIKEGSTVRQRQVLIRLPDKTQMQVKTMINESNISSVKVGMPAKITFDSIPNRVIEGEVVKVNLYPEIVWMSSAKDYVTLVKIKEDVPELRSGLTAQVRIIADEQKDVLMVPVHCVMEYGNKTYCLTYADGTWGCKEVLLGASNEKQVIILGGLEEGDLVVSGARNYRDKVEFPDPNLPSVFEDNEIYQQKLAEAKAEQEKNAEIEAGALGAEQVGLPRDGQGGFGGFSEDGQGVADFGGQGQPDGERREPRGGQDGGAGDVGGLPADFVAKLQSGDVPQELLANLPGGLPGLNNDGGSNLSADDLEERHKKMEEAAEYSKSIEEKLVHDVEIAAIEPFFDRTVMEMQRELLTAISDKTEALQARIATRQSEITRRQEEIELLQKTSEVPDSRVAVASAVEGAVAAEDSASKIARLTDEIKTLRGDSDVPTLERVVYLDEIDWDRYVSGNDVTHDAIAFLSQDSEEIFNKLFPNSKPIDVVQPSSVGQNSEEQKAEDDTARVDDESWLTNSDEEVKTQKSDPVDYSAFLPLFTVWDSNHDNRLKPTEFVIGFFSDRKSFQDSEADDDIEKLFAEYDVNSDKDALKTELTELPMDSVLTIADKIKRERSDDSSDSKRRNPRRDRRNSGVPGAGAPGAFPGGQAGGFPGGAPGAVANGDQPLSGASEGRDVGQLPPDGQLSPGSAPQNSEDGVKAVDVALPAQQKDGRPIRELIEASSIRQAVALYVDRMDFNGDGLLQKSEFVKGYHDIKDVAGKLFTSTTLINAVDSQRGGFGPPPR